MGWVMAVVLATAATGCTFAVKESHLVRPSPAPDTGVEALAAEFPAYRIASQPLAVDGARLHTVRFLHPEARATVVYFGGNGYRAPLHARFTALAYSGIPVNLLLADHRGYGASTGEVSLDAMRADAITVFDHVRADPVLGAVPVIVHGQSLGSFLAGGVAAQRRLDGLVLESSMTTAGDWATDMRARLGFWKRLAVRRFDIDPVLARANNLEVVRALDEPVLFVVGADDTATAPVFSQHLYDATPFAPPRKRLLVVAGRGHNDASRSPEFTAAMTAFVGQVAEGRGAVADRASGAGQDLHHQPGAQPATP